MIPGTTRIPEQLCPYCGEHVDRATPAPSNQDARPEPGNFSLCCSCAGILVYQADLTVRKATDEEIADVMKDATARRFIQIGQAFFRSLQEIKKKIEPPRRPEQCQ